MDRNESEMKNRKIEILGTEYEIIEKADWLVNGTEQDGHCDPNRHLIELKKTIRDKESLVHELGHAIMNEGGLFCSIPLEVQEVICQQYAHVITRLFYLRFK
jgi:Zn-dependent peptidase ImmA (M78 family)